jgi:hypothetical protein
MKFLLYKNQNFCRGIQISASSAHKVIEISERLACLFFVFQQALGTRQFVEEAFTEHV